MGNLRATFISVVVAALAGPALAECPTASNLASGIRVVFADRSEIYRTGDQGVVTYESQDEKGISFGGQLVQGLFPLSGGSNDLSDVNWSRDYGQSVTSIPRPRPEQTLLADFLTSSAWVTDAPGRERYDMGPLLVTIVGDCDLATFGVTVSESEQGSTRKLLYFADLGFAVSIRSFGSDGVASNDAPLRIEAVR